MRLPGRKVSESTGFQIYLHGIHWFEQELIKSLASSGGGVPFAKGEGGRGGGCATPLRGEGGAPPLPPKNSDL